MTMKVDPITDLVVPLSEADPDDRAHIGGKASGLAELLRGGFNVPDGIVITVNAFAETESEGGLSVAAGAAVDRVLRLLGEGPFAVRSSAVAEDSAGASFAGQFETVLDVTGRGDVMNAVQACWESSRSERVATYGGDTAHPIAVIVQHLVAADSAGVAFSADPVTGDRDVTIVSAVRGLGEGLVSGEVTPDEWEVRGNTVTTRTEAVGALNDDQVRAVADLVDRATSHFGVPQDLEWAMRGDALYALQSRPITGLPDVDPVEPTIVTPEDGFWFYDGGHYPNPISPMAATFYHQAVARNATAAFAEFGALIDGLEIDVIGWRAYARVVPPMGKDGPPPPAWLLGLLTRVVPPLRAKVRKGRDAARDGIGDRYIERWWNTWRSDFQAELKRLTHVDPETLHDDELIDRFRLLIDLIDRGQNIHFKLFVPYLMTLFDLMEFCTNELDWSESRTTELFAGLSQWSTEPARQVQALADLARKTPAVSAVLDRQGSATFDDLRSADEEFAAALDEYLANFGIRATAYEVAEPTVGENPQALISQLRDGAAFDAEAVQSHLTETRSAARDEARHRLEHDTERTALFEELMRKIERVYPVREDNVFFSDNLPLGLIRLTALEIGRRLSDRAILDDVDHVFFLSVEEAIDALESSTDHRELVLERRQERAWVERHSPQASFGTEYPPPDLSRVPTESRRLMEALMWFISRDLATPVGDGLTGTAAAPGTYTGPVRVVRGDGDFSKIRQGDVLVAPITTPAWTVLFSRAGALVTDTGGLLSHAAIIAREYGIPAVVATGTATDRLEDGQIVTVDGTSGSISVSK